MTVTRVSRLRARRGAFLIEGITPKETYENTNTRTASARQVSRGTS